MSAAEGKNTGDVSEPDDRARETKENMAKLKTKPGMLKDHLKSTDTEL